MREDCFLPSLLLHSSLSVQFELDCLARKHRGIASKLGATAGTNKTGIKSHSEQSETLLEFLVGFDNKIPFSLFRVRKGYYWEVLLIIEWYYEENITLS